MDSKIGVALGIFIILFASSLVVLVLGEEEVETNEAKPHFHAGDPLWMAYTVELAENPDLSLAPPA